MNPYYFPQIRIATVEGLPKTAIVSWDMDFIGDQGQPSRIELFEQGHSVVVYISDYVYGTLTLTPRIMGADISVDPITIEFPQKPKVVWKHGGVSPNAAVANLITDSFMRIDVDDEGRMLHNFVRQNPNCFVPISRADEVRITKYQEQGGGLPFLDVLCEQYESITRDWDGSITISNPQGPVFIKLLSSPPCGDGAITALVSATNAAYIDDLPYIELGSPCLENVWIAALSDEFPLCDYYIDWTMQHNPVTQNSSLIPRIIPLNERAILFTTELFSECSPIARPLSPGVLRITPKLIPVFPGLPEIDLDQISLAQVLQGCSFSWYFS